MVGGKHYPRVDIAGQHGLVKGKIKGLADAHVVKRRYLPVRRVVVDIERAILMKVGALFCALELVRRWNALIKLAVLVVSVLSFCVCIDVEVHLAQPGRSSPEIGITDQIDMTLVIPDLDLPLIA